MYTLGKLPETYTIFCEKIRKKLTTWQEVKNGRKHRHIPISCITQWFAVLGFRPMHQSWLPTRPPGRAARWDHMGVDWWGEVPCHLSGLGQVAWSQTAAEGSTAKLHLKIIRSWSQFDSTYLASIHISIQLHLFRIGACLFSSEKYSLYFSIWYLS